jgi:hypothetical protein
MLRLVGGYGLWFGQRMQERFVRDHRRECAGAVSGGSDSFSDYALCGVENAGNQCQKFGASEQSLYEDR